MNRQQRELLASVLEKIAITGFLTSAVLLVNILVSVVLLSSYCDEYCKKYEKEFKKLQSEVIQLKRNNNLIKEQLLPLMYQTSKQINVIPKCKITFYSNDNQSINKKEYRDGLTATGHKVGVGVCAVDSKLIPYGSVLFIKSLNRYCIALDTGSAIKGRHIDIYVDSKKEAIKNGVKISDVYIIGHISPYGDY